MTGCQSFFSVKFVHHAQMGFGNQDVMHSAQPRTPESIHERPLKFDLSGYPIRRAPVIGVRVLRRERRECTAGNTPRPCKALDRFTFYQSTTTVDIDDLIQGKTRNMCCLVAASAEQSDFNKPLNRSLGSRTRHLIKFSDVLLRHAVIRIELPGQDLPPNGVRYRVNNRLHIQAGHQCLRAMTARRIRSPVATQV